MEAWINRICKQCGDAFLVRRCYFKRGQGIFCSKSCRATFNNLTNKPSQRPEVKAKISRNHADVSGKKNPMYGKRGKDAPSFIDGRSFISGDTWRRVALANKESICEICGDHVSGRQCHVHHKDRNRGNNELSNLMVVCVLCHNTVLHKRERDALGRFVGGDLHAKGV